MDYFVIINGQKQGPYDVLGFIKKVKSGVITGDTQVSPNEAGPYRPASEMEDLKSIIRAETTYKAAMGKELNLNLNAALNEGADLWTRRVTEYTLFFGLVVVVGYVLAMGLNSVSFFADYPFINAYITTVVTLTLICFYCYYVLMTKRSQDADKKELISVLRFALPHLLIFSLIVSLPVLALGLSPLFTSISLAVAAILLSLLIFVPFLVTDHRMGLKRAITVSLESFRALKKTVGGALFIIIAVNIAAVFLPTLMGNVIFFLAFLITLPVSVAILANIYDSILA